MRLKLACSHQKNVIRTMYCEMARQIIHASLSWFSRSLRNEPTSSYLNLFAKRRFSIVPIFPIEAHTLAATPPLGFPSRFAAFDDSFLKLSQLDPSVPLCSIGYLGLFHVS